MTNLIFNAINTLILVACGAIIFFPKQKFSQTLMSYPWIPLGVSIFYLYFVILSGGLLEADFSSLEGIVSLFKKASPESAAAGWFHYLAFDFWVGVWIIKHSRIKGISHKTIILPLLFTFMLGPVGILTYSFILLGQKILRPASEN